MAQISLPNGCSCSEFIVSPSNWNEPGADLGKIWFVKYRFYDPSVIDERTGQVIPKQVVIKAGINRMKTLHERRRAIKTIIENELVMLREKGANPITREMNIAGHESIIKEQTPFLEAMAHALKNIDCERHTREDIASVLRYVEMASKLLNCHYMPISRITRRELLAILEQCGKMKRNKWSANTFNQYRKYLGILFSYLNEMMAIDGNPALQIKKKKHVARTRETLSAADRRLVDHHLRKKGLTSFRLFSRIFFHSGGRITELLKIKGKDVNLQEQWFKVVIKKGREYREVKKTIRNCALPYWKLIMATCGREDYVFSHGLVPGKVANSAVQVTRRWEKHVKAPVEKGGLGITADFYAFKHANSTETSKRYGARTTADQNNHTSTAMVVEVYDIGYRNRMHEQLKKVAVDFF